MLEMWLPSVNTKLPSTFMKIRENTQTCLLKVLADESIVVNFRLVVLIPKNIKLHVVS